MCVWENGDIHARLGERQTTNDIVWHPHLTQTLRLCVCVRERETHCCAVIHPATSAPLINTHWFINNVRPCFESTHWAGAIYCLVDRTHWQASPQRTRFLPLSTSLSLFFQLSTSLQFLSIHPPNRLSHSPFIPQPRVPPPTLRPPLHTTHLSSQGHLACLDRPSLSVCLSLFTRRISPLCLIILSLGQSVSHWMLQWRRGCRYCAATLRHPGSIVNGTGVNHGTKIIWGGVCFFRGLCGMEVSTLWVWLGRHN